jgi:site-specific DNA-adenine methylase
MPPYNGGKSGNGTYQNIINHIPPHGIYIAPFAGHDGVFQKIRRADISILNDKDQRVIEQWKKASLLKDCIVCESYMQGNLFSTPEKPVVILRNQDYASLIAKFSDTADAFIYCDPPYKMDTRRSSKKIYLFDWPTDNEHIDFLNIVLKCNCPVMVSAYESDLYNDMLKGWSTHKFNSMTRTGLREEIIYYNYPKPTILHDFQYLGKNYRERERIKRKVNRFESKMNRLPELERAAILSNIIAKNKTIASTLIDL